jgi:M6 family metalloprotease-like protein
MRKLYSCVEFFFVVLLGTVTQVVAVPASQDAFSLSQPNGVAFEARLWGDEWLNGTETMEGYTILKDASEHWVYARKNEAGLLEPSNWAVGRDQPIGLEKHLRPQLPAGQSTYAPLGTAQNPFPGVQPAPPTPGTHRLLVIFLDFTPTSNKGTTEAELAQHFFTGGGTYTPTSAANYWNTVSYSTLTLSAAAESYGAANNGIVMVTLGTANPLCGTSIGNCHRQLVRDAIIASDSFVNYSSLDTDSDGYLSTNELHLYVVVAGNEGSFGSASCGTPSTWGHRWSLGFTYSGTLVNAPTVDGKIVGHFRGAPTVGGYMGGYLQEGEWHESCPNHTPGHESTIGVSVHELGHDMGTGVPDLYDTSSTTGTNSFGIGVWALQGLGSWNFVAIGAGNHIGTHPAFPDPWSRWFLGFITPTAITGSTTGLSLPQIETAVGANRGVYFLPDASVTHFGGISGSQGCVGGTGEYFLVENRQLMSYDLGLPGAGLLIWHIYEDMDTCAPNSNEGTAPPGNPRLVVLEQADEAFGLECYSGGQCNPGDDGDPWPGSTNKTVFNDASTPNSKYYSGLSSNICISGVGAASASMTANIDLNNCGTPARFRVERATGSILADGSYNCGLLGSSSPVPPCFNSRSGADLAEFIHASEALDYGDVVEPDYTNPQHYHKVRSAYSTGVAGVISTQPGMTLAVAPNRPSLGLMRDPLLSLDGASLSFFSTVAHSSAISWLSLTVKSEAGEPSEMAISLSLRQVLEQHSTPPRLALVGRVPVKATTENGAIRAGDLLVSSSKAGYAMRCNDAKRCEGAIIGKALEALEQDTGIIFILVGR